MLDLWEMSDEKCTKTSSCHSPHIGTLGYANCGAEATHLTDWSVEGGVLLHREWSLSAYENEIIKAWLDALAVLKVSDGKYVKAIMDLDLGTIMLCICGCYIFAKVGFVAPLRE
jgi:hypothetical protein